MNGATIKEVRRYWDARPCNVRHGRAPVGTLEWSRQVTDRKYMVEPHIPAFAQFERWRGKHVVEVGCGIGTDTLEFVRHGANFVCAMDLSEESLKLAFSRFEAEGLWARAERKITFLIGNAEQYVPQRGFDLAYSFGVLHHTPRPLLALENMYSALRPGGELRIMVYATRSIKFWLGEQPEAQADCPVVKTFTKAQICRLVESVGFKVTSVRKTHIFPWQVKDYVEHRYVRRWPYRLMSRRFFSWLEGRLGHHLLVVARRPA